jgi:Fe-S-cluster formation regulator IscX/YfhJ
MKVAAHYILLAIVCVNSFSLQQLYKVPMLAIHYQEHHQLDPSVDFIDFLAMHYWGTDLNDNDDDRDNELPFKKIENAVSPMMVVPASLAFTITQQPNFSSASPEYQTPHFENAPTGSLFKPPRLA